MLHDYGIFLSNVCHLGLSKVIIIYSGVVLGLFWVVCIVMHLSYIKSNNNLLVIVATRCQQVQNYTR